MIAPDCPTCLELLDDYVVAVVPGFPATVHEYLSSLDAEPLCPLCDRQAGEHLDNDRDADDYLLAVRRGLRAEGPPTLCKLCAHRAAHYIERRGMFDYLAHLEHSLGWCALTAWGVK